MKIQVNLNEFTKLINSISNITKLDRITISAYDSISLSIYSKTISLKIMNITTIDEVKGEILLNGSFSLYFKEFKEAILNLSKIKDLSKNDISFTTNDDYKTLEVYDLLGNLIYKFYSVDIFKDSSYLQELSSKLKTDNACCILNLNGEDLKKALKKTIFAISKDESRPSLACANLSVKDINDRFKLALTTTDNYRLVRQYNDILQNHYGIDKFMKDFANGILLPARLINLLYKYVLNTKEDITNIKFKIMRDNYISIQINNSITFIDNFDTDNIPDYNHILNSYTNNEITATFNTKKLLKNLTDINKIKPTKIKQDFVIKLNVSNNEVLLSPNYKDCNFSNFTLKQECKSNADIIINFNCNYLIQFLKTVDSELVTFNFKNNTAPVSTIENDNIHIIMPRSIDFN